MTTAEQQLRQINSEGHWLAPNLKELGFAIDGLSQSIGKLREAGGWEGQSANAADALFEHLVGMYRSASTPIQSVSSAIEKANRVLTDAMNDVEDLPNSLISADAYAAIEGARSNGHETVRVLGFGPTFLVSEALHGIAGILGGNRDAAARRTRDAPEDNLVAAAKALEEPRIDLAKVAEWTFDPTGEGTSSTKPVPLPGSWLIVPNPTPIRFLTPPPDVSPSHAQPGGGSPAPSGGSFPSSPTYHNPSVDDGSVGTLPGYSGGSGGGFGAGGMGGTGGYGTGVNSGVTAGVFGGATAAGAAALRFGTGGGFGGGAGARSGAGSAGAAGASRGGMMGGQGMGGANGDKKDKRSGLGGLMAPKIEDDEPEFIPLPDDARAGGRNTGHGGSR